LNLPSHGGGGAGAPGAGGSEGTGRKRACTAVGSPADDRGPAGENHDSSRDRRSVSTVPATVCRGGMEWTGGGGPSLRQTQRKAVAIVRLRMGLVHRGQRAVPPPGPWGLGGGRGNAVVDGPRGRRGTTMIGGGMGWAGSLRDGHLCVWRPLPSLACVHHIPWLGAVMEGGGGVPPSGGPPECQPVQQAPGVRRGPGALHLAIDLQRAPVVRPPAQPPSLHIAGRSLGGRTVRWRWGLEAITVAPSPWGPGPRHP